MIEVDENRVQRRTRVSVLVLPGQSEIPQATKE